MTKSEILNQLMPFMDETNIVLRKGKEIIPFYSMKYGYYEDEGTLFIDINQDYRHELLGEGE